MECTHDIEAGTETGKHCFYCARPVPCPGPGVVGSFNRAFLSLNKVGNNADIDIRVFTTPKQEIAVTKCYPSEDRTTGLGF